MSIYEELTGAGWTDVMAPPRSAGGSVIALYEGKPIKAGVEVDRIEDSSECIHTRYRTGEYLVDMKIDEDGGQVLVEDA